LGTGVDGSPVAGRATAARAPAPRADAAGAAQFGAILKETRKALKNRQLYSHIEHHGEEQLLAIYGRFVRFLQESGEVTLRVEVSSFLWDEHEVFVDDGHDINFGYSLYRAGVRQLTIRPALSWEEFLSFWSLLAADLTEKSSEDLLTRLWRQGFDNVSWIAQVQLDAEEEDVELFKAVEASLAEAMRTFSADRVREAYGSELAMLLTRFSQQAAAQGTLAEDEQTPSAEQARAERVRVLAAVATTLVDITQLRSFPESEEYVAEAFEQLATSLLAENDAPALGSLAELAIEKLQQPAGPVQDAAVKLGIGGFVKSLTSARSIHALRALLESPSIALTARSFGALVRLLSGEGSQLLLGLLDAKMPTEFRTVILRVMAHVPAEQAVHVARRIRTADERLALELLGVIETMQVPRRVMLCEPALGNPVRAVRRQALEVMGRVQDDPGGPQMLTRHLERCADQEERLEYIAAIARFANAESERALTTRLQRPELDPRELTALWRGVLSSESPTAYAAAARVAAESTRGLLGSAKDESKKAALVEALGEVPDVQSVRVLASIAHEENLASRVLVKRAQDVLAGMKTRLGATGGA
jgi:hypothetical protein